MLNENQQQESEMMYRLLTGNNNTWDYMTDADGNWLYSSPACMKITGFNNNELLNDPKLFYNTIRPNHSKRIMEHFDIESTLESSFEEIEFPILKQNSEIRWISHSCSPVLNDDGDIIGRRCNNSDVTKYKKLLEDYKLTQVAAQNTNKLRTLFLANISHEIRTPLTSMLGYTDLIEDHLIDNSSEDLKECISSIRNSGERLMNTVHGIVDLSLIESGNYPENPKSLQFYKILNAIYNKYRKIADEKKILLDYDNQAQDLVITADEDHLFKAISNLVDNAIKFTEEGKVDIILKYVQHEPVLTIADTGVGIEKEYLSQIFEPFSQEKPDFTVGYQGLGIGMAITKHCLETAGASIVINSQINFGTTVIITF